MECDSLSLSKGTRQEGFMGAYSFEVPLEDCEWGNTFYETWVYPGDEFSRLPAMSAGMPNCNLASSNGSVSQTAIGTPEHSRWAYSIRKAREMEATPKQPREEEPDDPHQSFQVLCTKIESEASQEEVEQALLRLEATLQHSNEPSESCLRLITDLFLSAVTDPEAVFDVGTMGRICTYHRDLMTQDKEAPILVTSANVTSWRRDLLSWRQNCKGQILLLQETHLWGQKLMDFGIDAYKAGFHRFGGEGSKPDPKPKGGVGVLCPSYACKGGGALQH